MRIPLLTWLNKRRTPLGNSLIKEVFGIPPRVWHHKICLIKQHLAKHPVFVGGIHSLNLYFSQALVSLILLQCTQISAVISLHKVHMYFSNVYKHLQSRVYNIFIKITIKLLPPTYVGGKIFLFLWSEILLLIWIYAATIDAIHTNTSGNIH